MQFALADANLQLCDPENDGRPGLNFIGLRSMSGVAEQRFNPANWSHNSLHPNERGHDAMLRTFEHWYQGKQLLPPEEKVAQPPELVPVDDVDAACDPLDLTEAGCRRRSTTWALKQVPGALAGGKAVVASAAAFGIWISATAFFGWRRRRYRTA